MKKHLIQVQDTIGGTVKIKPIGRNEWAVIQRNYGAGQDNNQNPVWLSIFNAGNKTRIKIILQWAIFDWMGYHKIGYIKQAGKYSVIRGEITPTATSYQFDVPSGESFFGAFPWFSNEDNELFLRDISAPSFRCTVRSIGRSGAGREIRCLTIADKSIPGKQKNVVIIGREHATEPSGSFAVVGSVKYLLSGRAPAGILKHYNFHLLPIVNPDGTARGMKLTQPGPEDTYDMLRGSMTSRDPAIKALREEVLALRPACLIMHHSYLPSAAWIGVYDKKVGVAMMNELLPAGESMEASWSLRKSGRETVWLRGYCRKHFNSTVVVTELPWAGRLPAEIEKQGEDVLRATLVAHEENR